MTGTGERFGIGHASGESSDAVLAAALAMHGPVPEGANLGIVYLTDHLVEETEEIVARLRVATGVDHWVGTVGIGVAATGVEYFDIPALVIMTAAFPEDALRLLPPQRVPGVALDPSLDDWVAAHRPVLGLVHGDPRNETLGEVIADISELTQAFLVGGLSSARGAMPQIAGGIAEGCLSGVLFAEEVGVVTGLSQGCAPLGPARTVTEARRNLVHRIDGRPAFEVLREDLGSPDDPRELAAVLPIVHVALPIPGSDQADYTVRNLVGVDPQSGAIGIGALVDPGDRLIFCRRDPDSAESDLRRMLRQLRGRLTEPPQAGIYTSCLARGPNMFGPASRELAILREELGDVPVVGFYANGEISNARLYGYTGVLTLFR